MGPGASTDAWFAITVEWERARALMEESRRLVEWSRALGAYSSWLAGERRRALRGPARP